MKKKEMVIGMIRAFMIKPDMEIGTLKMVGARGFEPPTSCSQSSLLFATPVNTVPHDTIQNPHPARRFVVPCESALTVIALRDRDKNRGF
ncbi:hypothetical protein [Candidatus Nitronereus thalassa]|uniref:Uncharacterized protein n=1 Tax=Candidatus Nitronereus thalassa TaxID=3020898 RepID=A0ABU3K337_9BACT|nr:hypothetical protein [Candidatus Nitronereus thalassa]MDT7040803.1 hypothetical protein [Candidatus Nitronereus thalassa]